MRVGVALALLPLFACGRWGYEGDALRAFAPCTAGDDGNFVDPDTGNCYMRFETGMEWDVAVAFCESLGPDVHLATMNDATENTRVSSALIFGDNCAYLGGSDALSEGTFQWITGEPMGFTNFDVGQPDDFGEGEDCLQFFGDGTWNDIACFDQFPSLCEREASGPPPPCSGGDLSAINPVNGGCFSLFSTPRTWTAARIECEALGGHLATIHSPAENSAVHSLVVQADVSSAWLGASDVATEGAFEWVTPEAMTFSDWADGEPNNDGGEEDCLEIWNEGGWNDNVCSNGQAYICEID